MSKGSHWQDYLTWKNGRFIFFLVFLKIKNRPLPYIKKVLLMYKAQPFLSFIPVKAGI